MTLSSYHTFAIAALLVLAGSSIHAQITLSSTVPETPQPTLRLDIPHSWNPLSAYRATPVAAPNLANSALIDELISDGVLHLSLKNAIELALENNLDLAIARYNIPIAQADILRTEAGGVFRGVNTGVVQNTPGTGTVGAGGAGAGGTTGGAGGAGGGAGGLVQSTLGSGSSVSSYDPTISITGTDEHYTEPLANTISYGVPTLRSNSIYGQFNFTQSLPTGTTLTVLLNNDRIATNSANNILTPELDSYYRVEFQQQLLSGFGLSPNLRYLRIARNNQKISDQSFQLQIISTVTQIENIYWDLVNAYEDEKVKQASLDFANQTFDSDRKQLELQAIPALDVLKAEGEVAAREQDLTIAKSTLQFQELLIKNALTKNLDDPVLEAMPVQPTDLSTVATDSAFVTTAPTEDVIQQALKNRIELSESSIDLKNRDISLAAVRNSLLPTLELTAWYGGTGLGGLDNVTSGIPSTAPTSNSGQIANAFKNDAPDYYVGLSLNIPLRNRIAKSDEYRAGLELRQAQLRSQQLQKQIRIEVRNAQYALEQSAARVTSATKARELAQKTFDITTKEQSLGAGSALQTLASRHDLATAESMLVAARTAYQKASVELDRATGRTLVDNAISVESARTGVVSSAPQKY
ncbi:TolC family protein [Granulicella mallensis]|jgi:outer membrane protein TolC|uniref:Outer membrane protein TolC n=1 Tax=Granulicella mallensis TaxID=940614 RepID=A0A7W7ZM51_9BACT|nr:TolC family protein [Granulicella mallensis]MBB5062263.1 outer membrane protein TolC [Granulicella mallensis]